MIEELFVLAILIGFVVGVALLCYVAVEIIWMCIEAIIYLVERRKRRKKKGGI